MKLTSHPQRDDIWQELHARPYVRFSAPAHVLHLSFFLGERDGEPDRANLMRLKENLGLVPTYETPKHGIFAGTIADLGRLVLCWERHAEFVAYTFFLYELEIPFRPFGFDFTELVPAGWLESFGISPVVATRLAIGHRKEMPDTPEGLMALFEGHTVNGSQVMGGRAEAWSCYRAHEDGFGRIAIVVHEMSPQDLGRTVERLLAIENSYHLTLLSLPAAREVKPELASAERRMVLEMDALRSADSLEQKRTVLDALLALAAEVEHLRARVSNRFAGSSAYFSLLESRFTELREDKIEHVLRLSRFVMRRVRPAAETYRGLLERLANLSKRIDRSADLLRTSIELHVEEQNARLLEGADRRARLQLRLQEAVESLSVVVITYYALGLAGYALKGIKARGFDFDLDATLGLALPFLALAVWGVVQLIRKRFRGES
jgi:uncharacterized membrane-anchored protein